MNLELNLFPKSGDFTGFATYRDIRYDINFCDFDKGETEKGQLLALQITEWIDGHLPFVKAFAASELVGLKNSTWLEPDEEEVTEEVFIGRLEITSLMIFADGNFEVYFEDNDLFWGHWIRTDVNEDFSLDGAEIVG